MNSRGNPILAVDAIIELDDGVVLIKRKYEPFGWAIPGGIVDEGESCEHAVVREAKEETGLDVKVIRQLGTYSDPKRDPRKHVVSVVFICKAVGGKLKAADDAVEIACAYYHSLWSNQYDLCFDHKDILTKYFEHERVDTSWTTETRNDPRRFHFEADVKAFRFDIRVEGSKMIFEAVRRDSDG